jgi:hypothetical protein
MRSVSDFGAVQVAKYRGDEDRDFVKANYNTNSFPTINVVTKDGKVSRFLLIFVQNQTNDVYVLKMYVEDGCHW